MDGEVMLTARTVPPPRAISAEARAFFDAVAAMPSGDPPASDDHDGWRAMIAMADVMIAQRFAPFDDLPGLEQDRTTLGGRTAYVATPAGARADLACLDLHGGGLTMGGGDVGRLMGLLAATQYGVRTFSLDYRMPPDHPYPAALDDCVGAYRDLLERYDPAHIVVGGQSAGGNLAAALVLRARDEGLPLPAGLVLLTPKIDLTESGDSFQTNRDIDVLLRKGMPESIALYAAGHDLAHPYLSPLFGDFGKGFPPTFLQAGTRDIFLSNTVRMHRALLRAGVPAELHIFEGMPHGGFGGGAPEDQDLAAAVRAFVAACTPG